MRLFEQSKENETAEVQCVCKFYRTEKTYAAEERSVAYDNQFDRNVYRYVSEVYRSRYVRRCDFSLIFVRRIVEYEVFETTVESVFGLRESTR